jgi:hypothetical protein
VHPHKSPAFSIAKTYWNGTLIGDTFLQSCLRQILSQMLKFTISGALIGAGCAYFLSTLLPSGHIEWSGSGVFLYGVARLEALRTQVSFCYCF